MAKKNKKSKSDDKEIQRENEQVVTQNRKARYHYQVIDTLECGLALVGSEVKSLRTGRVSLEEAYGRVMQGEVWLMGCDIPEYVQANRLNHVPKRPRKLLLHKREVKKFANKALENGLTLVPLKIYFTRGRAKVLLGLCKGKKHQDKRESIKKKDVQRDLRRAMKGRG